MKINFGAIFGTTLVTVLVALLIFELVGAPLVGKIKSALGLDTYDGTPMAFDGEKLTRDEWRRRLAAMRKESVDDFTRRVEESVRRNAA